MTIRTCDGSSGSGLDNESPANYCKCGGTFDDLDKTMVYPHGYLASGVITYNYPAGGAYPAGTIATGGIGGGPYANWPLNSWSVAPQPVTPIPPNSLTLSRAETQMLAEAYSSLVRNGEKIVICVDLDVTQEQVKQLCETLDAKNIDGVVIRGARNGYGFPYRGHLPTEQEKRLDVLARIADMWEQRPELRLTDLLAWYRGEDMADEDFAAAIEVHFSKANNGIHRKP